MRVRTFRDLVVWQKAFALCVELYGVTRQFPTEERFGLSAETRKTARSVACNIAEGHRRRSTTEFLRFLDIASASAAELETQLLLAAALGYLPSQAPLDHLREVDRMLSSLIHAVRKKLAP